MLFSVFFDKEKDQKNNIWNRKLL